MSPTSDDVRLQLDRLLASAVFANAGRMSRFLRFVVERTLAGEGERLKEYVVGIEVFDRATDYDPRVDSIVRVEAARLRSKLAEYYAGEGRGDAVVVTLPKGGYAAVVKVADGSMAANGAPAANGTAATNSAASIATVATRLEETPAQAPRSAQRRWALAALVTVGTATAAAVAWWPDVMPVAPVRVAVLPFAADTTDADAALAQRITEGVTAELVRAGHFNVVGSSAARAEYAVTRRPRDVATALDADLLIEARLTTNNLRVLVEARAVNGKSEAKVWVRDFAGDRADTDPLEREIAAAIDGAFGSIASIADEPQ
jgi:TolB-like protein